MNRWPKHKAKTEARLCIEYLRCRNPVTRSVFKTILFNRSLESRNYLHRLIPWIEKNFRLH